MDRLATYPSRARIHLAAGAAVFRQGEPGCCAYLVESGAFRIEHRAPGGEVSSTRAGANDILGEMALVHSGARNSTAIAECDAVIIPVTRDTIGSKLEGADPLTRTVTVALIRRLRELMDPTRTKPPAWRMTRLRTPARKELEIAACLETVLAKGRIQACFQPIVSCRGLEPVGFEALFRLTGDPPDGVTIQQCIEVAERTGLIDEIGRRMLLAGQAFRDRLASMAGGEQNPFVSVNVSAEQLARPHAARELLQALRRNGAHDIHLEITETAFSREPARLRRLLGHCQRAGASLSLDDFGTGYSSIGYLNRFPINTLKIDRSFVAAMETRPMAAKLVRTIVTLGRELDIETIAEGVESGAQLCLLREIGCGYIQGFYIAPAMDATRAEHWLRLGRATHSSNRANDDLPALG